MDTYVIAYGDNSLNGRGIYSIKIDGGEIVSKPVYSLNSKPGAMIVLDKFVFLSYSNDDNCGVLTFSRHDDSTLTLVSDELIPYFVSVFSWNKEANLLLGCSFYDGVDVLFSHNETWAISDVIHHRYRERSDDPRQTLSHPHNIGMLGSSNYGYSVDLGTDLIVRFQVQAGQFSQVDQQWMDRPFGSGPRIIRQHPNGRFLYLLNEIGNSVTAINIDAEGHWQEIQTLSTLENNASLSSAAGIQITDNGKYLLVSNRGEDSLVLFQIDQTLGTLSFLDRAFTGNIPRDITLLTNEQILVACQKSNSIQYFAINKHQMLEFRGEVSDILSPVVFTE